MDQKTLKLVQHYVANIAIGASTLRNQGAKKVVGTARTFLASVDLMPLKSKAPSQYGIWLDDRTFELEAEFEDLLPKPNPSKKWGPARKALNIFLCHAFLNRYLCETYALDRLGDVMETPLDMVAATELRKWDKKGRLKRWKTVSGLNAGESKVYQEVATDCAKEHEIPRACLDVVLWNR